MIRPKLKRKLTNKGRILKEKVGKCQWCGQSNDFNLCWIQRRTEPRGPLFPPILVGEECRLALRGLFRYVREVDLNKHPDNTMFRARRKK